MCGTKSQRLWELPILPAHVWGLEVFTYWDLKETRKSTCKMGQHVGMVNPLLNVAVHLLLEMPLQRQKPLGTGWWEARGITVKRTFDVTNT